MRVFVTGAAGFIGSRLSKARLARGDQVLGFDNFDPYYDRSHKERHLADLRDETGFEFIEGSLHDAQIIVHVLATLGIGIGAAGDQEFDDGWR